MREIKTYSVFVICFGLLSVLFISTSMVQTGESLVREDLSPDRIDEKEPMKGWGHHHFTENLGQWDPSIDFSCNTGFGMAAFGSRGVSYYMVGNDRPVEIEFDGMRTSRPVGKDDMGFPTNFFLGNDPDRWISGARSYEMLVYENVWSGIDIEYYFAGSDLKYDIVVHPEGDPEDIDLNIKGYTDLEILENVLSIKTAEGTSIRDGNLRAMSDMRADIPVKFVRTGSSSYGFDIKKRVGETLTIDPLIYSTLISGGAYPIDFTKDDMNCTYFLGTAYSPDLPVTPGVFNTTYLGVDHYMMKMNATGTGILFATVIGGYTVDVPVAIKVDEKHDIYIGGRSCSPNFPTTFGVIQSVHNSVDDYTIMKLNSTGEKLIYSTFIGGDGPDILGDIEVVDGNVYLAGYSLSHDIPSMMGPIGGVHGIWYFALINNQATGFIDSMMWDGYESEYPFCLEVDKNGEVVIGGFSGSTDFPRTDHSFQSAPSTRGSRGIIIRYNPFTKETIFSSAVGAGAVYDLKLDENSDIFYTGVVRWDMFSAKPEFPLTNGVFMDDFQGYNDIYVAKLNGNGTDLQWCTLVGGSQNETKPKMTLDETGNAYVIGTTHSRDLPITPGCYDSYLDGEKDVFFFKLSPNGSDLLYSSYFGTNETEESVGILLEEMNNFTLFGITGSEYFPVTSGAYTLGNITHGGMFLSTFTISTAPGRTLNLTATEGDGNISLRWEPPIDLGNRPLTFYNIYRGLDRFNLTGYMTVDTRTSYKDTNVEFGIEYFYGVSALNEVGEGALSDIASNISSTLPDPPKNFQVEVNIGEIVISFQPPDFTGGVDILSYRIYRDGSMIGTLPPGDHIFPDRNIDLGRTYTYHATSFNRKGESVESKNRTVISKDLPSSPMGLTADALEDRIYLRWQEPENFGGLEIDRYLLYKGPSPDNLTSICSLEPDDLQFEDHFTVLGEEYYYSVSATNRIGESDLADPVSTKLMRRPSKPINLKAEPGQGYIEIIWSAPTDPGGTAIDHYRIYHGTSDNEASLFNVVPGDVLNFRHDGLSDTGIHHYHVTAVNRIGESEASDTVYASTVAFPGPPSEIRCEPGPYTITIKWDRPLIQGTVPVMGYTIFRRIEDSSPEEVANTGPNVRVFKDNDLARQTKYHYWIITESYGMSSDPSDEVSGVPLSDPDEPINVEVEPKGVGLKVSWEAPVFDGGSAIEWYTIYRTDPIGITVTLKNVNGENRSFEDYSILSGSNYSYHVKALNEVGSSLPSEIATGRNPGPPLRPEIVSIEAYHGSVILKWERNSTPEGGIPDNFNIHRIDPEGQVELIATVRGHCRSFIDDDVIDTNRYEYFITAINEAGESDKSNTISIELLEDDNTGKEDRNTLTWTLAGSLMVLLLLIIITNFIRGRRGTADRSMIWEEE